MEDLELITLVYNFESKSSVALREKPVMELKSDFQIDQSQNNF